MAQTGDVFRIEQLSLDLELEKSYNFDGTGPASSACVFVRYATESDLPQVLKMYLEALGQLFPNMKIVPEKAARVVWDAFLHAPCILLQKKSEILGFAGLRTGTCEVSNDAFIHEYMFYIKKEHRSVKFAKMLSDAAQEVAQKFGLPLSFSHKLGNSSLRDKEKFLIRWGYKPVAIDCLYEV